MKKQLPYIAFEGVGNTDEEVLDSLIAIEPILVMAGWDNPIEEQWNNFRCNGIVENTHLYGYEEGEINYHNHHICSADIIFKATEIDKFINYMIKEGYLV